MGNCERIIEIIERAVHGFEVQIGVSPNRIGVSPDVYGYLFAADVVTGNRTEERQIMGMVVDIFPEKERFIEVGYMTNAMDYERGE